MVKSVAHFEEVKLLEPTRSRFHYKLNILLNHLTFKKAREVSVSSVPIFFFSEVIGITNNIDSKLQHRLSLFDVSLMAQLCQTLNSEISF